MGSSRAAVHQWFIDVDQVKVSLPPIGHPQIRQSPLNVDARALVQFTGRGACVDNLHFLAGPELEIIATDERSLTARSFSEEGKSSVGVIGAYVASSCHSPMKAMRVRR